MKFLVCNSLTDGCKVPSNLRECAQCDTQLWVSLVMTALVDSGELAPLCRPCHRQTGRTVTIHPREIEALTALGRLAEGWRMIGEMNSPGTPKIGGSR